MKKIYRVNMTDLKVKEEPLAKEYERLGGRGLTSSIVAKEVPAASHPLGSENKLVYAPGLLGGTSAASSGRLSVGAKSPLTGGIKESNAGGTAAHKLARLGIAAIVVEGKSSGDTAYVLKVSSEGVELVPAADLKSLGNYELVERLRKRFGKDISCISCGPAGEMLMSAASIAVTDREGRPTRHAGRGGMGAVMGSKKLKAIVVDDSATSAVKPKNREAFTSAARVFTKALEEHEITSVTLPKYGTNVCANLIQEVGAYPTRNFSTGEYEDVDKISGETQRDVILERGGIATHACLPGCKISCSRIWVDKNGNYVTKGPEYETIWANGANCGINDLDAIATMDRLYDDYGIDTIEMGVTIAVAMEAGVKEFGDAQGAIELVKEVGKGTPLGRILGNGAAVTGQAFGVSRVPVVKRQGLPAYDPRSIKGQGVTYATSPMGADHTAGYMISRNVFKIGGYIDPLKADGQAKASREMQISAALVDSLGLCLFVTFATDDKPEAWEAVRNMVNALYGWDLTEEDFQKLGKSILSTEVDFNRRAGFCKTDDRLPYFFKTEKLPPHNSVFDVSDKDLDGVLKF
ncbi:MAG: aldehyde ferredoxin oxidoreductase C-terminal domain-containing protein [Candidatus Aerophobetes bacterium]